MGGSIAMLVRRYQKKSTTNISHDWQYLYMHGFLISACVMGFMLGGIRTYMMGRPEFELWAPISYAFSIPASYFSEEVLAISHRWIWFWHMVFTMVFVGSIPFTRFYHFIGAFLTSRRSGKQRMPVFLRKSTSKKRPIILAPRP